MLGFDDGWWLIDGDQLGVLDGRIDGLILTVGLVLLAAEGTAEMVGATERVGGVDVDGASVGFNDTDGISVGNIDKEGVSVGRVVGCEPYGNQF